MNQVRTSLTTSAGKMIDLLAPAADDIDLMVIAEHLAKANRYCGATPGVSYSVAQHSVICGNAARVATGDRRLVAYLLCHDMHEAYLGDDTTPKKRALQSIMSEFGTLAGEVEKAFNLLTYRLDVAIHEAFGLSWPPSSELQKLIKFWDTVALATEWRDLMRCAPPFDFGVPPLVKKIVPLDWQASRDLLVASCKEFLPKLTCGHGAAETEDPRAQPSIARSIERSGI
jgi:5'-deoxynucleotidase YfbR-like HD superfamily hydrolase